MRFRRLVLPILLTVLLAVGCVAANRIFAADENGEAQIVLGPLEKLHPRVVTAETNPIKVSFFYNAETSGYDLFLPACTENKELTIHFDHAKSLVIDGTAYADGDRFDAASYLSDGQRKPHTLQALVRGAVTAETVLCVYRAEELPSVHIDTSSGSMAAINSDINHETRERMLFVIYRSDGRLETTGDGLIGGRGNQSWTMMQKPYRMNLRASDRLLDIGPSDKWTLLSNHQGGVWQLQNHLALETGRLCGLAGTPESTFVDLYLNGEYNGVYLLAPAVTTPGENLLELEWRTAEEDFAVNAGDRDAIIHEPSKPSEAERTQIADAVLEAAASLKLTEDPSIPARSPEEIFDYASWRRMFLLQDFYVNWDYNFASIYFYQRAGGTKFYAGPLWDMDRATGGFYTGTFRGLAARSRWIGGVYISGDLEGHRGSFLEALYASDSFTEGLPAVWRESVSPAADMAWDAFPSLADALASSVSMEAVRWNRDPDQFDRERKELADWLVLRTKTMDAWLDHPEELCTVTFDFGWGRVPCLVKRGEALGYLPLPEYGDCEASGLMQRPIAYWADENDTPVTAELTVDQDITLHAVR